MLKNGEEKRWGKKEVGEKKVALVMCMELNRVVDAPRRGPAAGTAARRDRWGKEGGLVNIYYKLLLLFANSSFECEWTIPTPTRKKYLTISPERRHYFITGMFIDLFHFTSTRNEH